MKDVIIDFINHSVTFHLSDDIRLKFRFSDDYTTDISIVDRNLITANFKYDHYDLIHSGIVNYSEAKDTFEQIIQDKSKIVRILDGYDDCVIGSKFRPCNIKALGSQFVNYLKVKLDDLISAKIHDV